MDIQKRLEELEARVEKLEKLLDSGVKPNKNVGIAKATFITQYSVGGFYVYPQYIIESTDGTLYRAGRWRFGQGYKTIKDVRNMADILEVAYNPKDKAEQIIIAIQKKYGKDGSAIIQNYAVRAPDTVYSIHGVSVSDLIECFTNQEWLDKYYKDAKPFEYDSSWTTEQKARALIEYVNKLISK